MALSVRTPSLKLAAHMPSSPVDESALRIGLLNLMPNKVETECQWYQLLAPCKQNVTLNLLRLTSYTPKNTPADYLAKNYFPAVQNHLNELNGVIITGAPLGQKPLSEISYLPELKHIIEHCRHQEIPILFSCWAANIAIHLQFGIQLHRLDTKLSGIFEHKNQLEQVKIPHSRYGQLNIEALRQVESLQIELESEQAGPTFLTDESGNYYLLGHPEYSANTLWHEYQRDQRNGLNPELPYNLNPSTENQTLRQLYESEWRAYGVRLLQRWIAAMPGDTPTSTMK